MADNNVTVDPRYMKYDKDDVERLLEKIDNSTVATEENVRNIVKNYMADTKPGTEQESESESES